MKYIFRISFKPPSATSTLLFINSSIF